MNLNTIQNEQLKPFIKCESLFQQSKTTDYPSIRYIIPVQWLDNILTFNLIDLSAVTKINNSQFLNITKTNILTNIENKIALITHEMMIYINSICSIDIIILTEVKLNNNKYAIVKIFIINANKLEEFFKQIKKINTPINSTYIKYPNFEIININNSNILPKKTENSSFLRSTSLKSNFTFNDNNKYLFNRNNLIADLNSFEKLNLPVIGLVNPSVYCYMISCLQILLSIPELNFYFFNKKYKSKNNTPICDNFTIFIKSYYSQQFIGTTMPLPQPLFTIVSKILPINVMNDSEEFLLLFLDLITSEINTENKLNKNSQNNNIENTSFIDLIFCGLIQSNVICKKCSKISSNYEPFMDLSISLTKSNKCIYSCLEKYFEQEIINCDYFCEQCKSKTSVSKYFLIINYIYRLIKN